MARFEYRHFPWHGRISEFAALAMGCAADQSGSAFWALHDRLMTDAAARRTQAQITAAGERVVADQDQFGQCLEDRTHEDAINEGIQAARRLGVRSTPAIYVNDSRAGITIASITAAVERATP